MWGSLELTLEEADEVAGADGSNAGEIVERDFLRKVPLDIRASQVYRIIFSDRTCLLCGKHHRAVDRHESLYSVAELEGWKARQRESGDPGVSAQLSDNDLRAYRGLSNEEREALANVARLAQRVIATCEAGYQAAEQVRRDAEQAQRASVASFGPIYAVDEAGNQTRVNPRDISLPGVELRK
jgi:hypothetical protein